MRWLSQTASGVESKNEMPVQEPKQVRRYAHRGKRVVRHELDEARVTHETWKLGAPVLAHLFPRVSLEVPVARTVKRNQDGHDLTETELPRPLALPQAVGELLALPGRFHPAAEIIDGTEQFE